MRKTRITKASEIRADRRRALVWPGVLSVFLGLPGLLPAHETLRQCIRHEVLVTVGEVNTDVEISLVFHEEPSQVERQVMDANGDGGIEPGEIARYTEGLAERWVQAVTLRFDGERVPLVPLYNPDINLLGVDKPLPAHHRLVLSYFARTPASFTVGSVVGLEEELWSDVPALWTGVVRGGDDIEMVERRHAAPTYASIATTPSGSLEGRCVKNGQPTWSSEAQVGEVVPVRVAPSLPGSTSVWAFGTGVVCAVAFGGLVWQRSRRNPKGKLRG